MVKFTSLDINQSWDNNCRNGNRNPPVSNINIKGTVV